MRAFGKGYEEFYQRIKEEGVNMIRGKTATVNSSGEKLLLRSEDMEHGRLVEQEVDMVVLAVGLEPRNDSSRLAKILGITLDENGWFREASNVSDTTGTYTGGITIAGVCQGPKDIPDSVAQGSAAASRVLQSILTGKIRKSLKDLTLEDLKKKEKEITIMEEK
jgi:heterodisulfide reductase subunit A